MSLYPLLRMISYLFSADYATCAVPEAYREIFRGSEETVASTEGWEPGALNLAQGFAMKFRTPLVHGDVTRLLIDFSKNGDERWSRFSLKLPETTRAKLEDRHERPYRTTLRQRIEEDLKRYSAVVHVMVHADADTAGIVKLQTRAGAGEAEKLAALWRARLTESGVEVRHVTGQDFSPLAKVLSEQYRENYILIRLGVSQSFFLEGKPLRWETLKRSVLDSLMKAGEEYDGLNADQESP